MNIKINGITDQIYEELKNKIKRNDLKFGEKITINKIAEEYKISYTPVREAIKRLVKDGWIINIPNKSHIVFDLKEKDLFQIMELRKMIECFSIGKAIVNLNPKVFNDYYKKITVLEPYERKSTNIYRYYEDDIKFHKIIVKGTFNHKIIDIYIKNIEVISLIIYRISVEGDLFRNILNEHIELLEYIIKKDIKKSRTLLAKHIDHSFKYYLENFYKKDS